MAGKKDVEELGADIVKSVTNSNSKKQDKSSDTTVTVDEDPSTDAPQNGHQQEETSGTSSTTSATTQFPAVSPLSPVAIPTIMITENDGRELIRMQQEISQLSSFTSSTSSPHLHLTIQIQSLHGLLITELFGNIHYPKVWMTKSVIYTLSKGLWGAYFKTQKGDDWQMYLIDKRDSTSVRLIPAMTIRNQEQQKLSTTFTLLKSPEQLYQMMLKRKCPSYLKSSIDGKIVRIQDSLRNIRSR